MPETSGRPEPRLLACGDTAISVDFGERISAEVNARVMALDAELARRGVPEVVETVPTYRALTVHVDPLTVDWPRLRATLAEFARRDVVEAVEGRHWRVPVVYGGAFGADLEAVAAGAGLSTADVVAAHSAPVYTVFMIGFLPGFSYLGGLDPLLATPRRPEPRLRVPASSVSIGGEQTAIHGVEGPSGWHLIGRSPVRPFMPRRDPPFLFAPGDRIRFQPCPESAWERLDGDADAGRPVAEVER